jgi:NhaA family Na+:H+ antiporter
MIRKVIRYVLGPIALFAAGLAVIDYALYRTGRGGLARASLEVPGLFDMPGWEDHAALGHRIGPRTAPVTAFVYSDYQCPWSAKLWFNLKRVRERYPSELAIVYRHFPLDDIHPGARGAAHAAVCGERAGAFAAVHNALFEHTDSLGAVPWATIAARAGLVDTAAFVRCMEDEGVWARVSRDQAAARRMKAPGTPFLLVNGTFSGYRQTTGELERAVERALEERRLRTETR